MSTNYTTELFNNTEGIVISVNTSNNIATISLKSKKGFKLISALPESTHFLRVPVPGERVDVIRTSTGFVYKSSSDNRISFADSSTELLGKDKVEGTGSPYSSTSTDNEPVNTNVIETNRNSFNSDVNKNSLKLFLGDTILQSRYGSSIRWTTTPKKIDNLRPNWSKAEGLPLTIIVNGSKGVLENINSDDSSIWLTSGQEVEFKLSNKIQKNSNSLISQILMNSDRIVLNTKNNDIVLSSGSDTYINSKKETKLVSKTISLNTNRWDSQVDEVLDILHDLILEISKLGTGQAQFQTAQGPTLLSTNVSELLKLVTRIKKMKT